MDITHTAAARILQNMRLPVESYTPYGLNHFLVECVSEQLL